VGGNARTKLTRNGLLVAARTCRTHFAAVSGAVHVSPMPPRAPALETAAANTGPAIAADGAWMMGICTPSNSVKRFMSSSFSPGMAHWLS
jgi:hypothetical protein